MKAVNGPSIDCTNLITIAYRIELAMCIPY